MIPIEDIRRKIEAHRNESFITCPEDCWCWGEEVLIMEKEMEDQ